MIPGKTASVLFAIFVGGTALGQVTIQMSVDSTGTEGNAASSGPVLSADGRYVAFYSDATNLVPNDTNGVRDVFVHDRATGLTELVSVDSSDVEGDDLSSGPSMS